MVVLLAMAGCGGGEEAAVVAEPVGLPPSRTPASPTTQPTAALTPPPAPTAVPTRPPSPTPTTEALSPLPTPLPSATPLPPTETPVPLTPIGQLGAWVGQEVTVAGRVVGTASFSAGFKFTLDDGSGQVTLLMWHTVYDDCWDAAGLNLGAQVQVTAPVESYEGALQIVPTWGGGVTVLQPAAAWAELRAVNTLGDADEGQRVMIEGQVVRTSGFQSAVEVYVGDGTGDFKVFIWRTVLDRILQNTALGTPGSHVRVVGTVTRYRDALELVPTLPYDVVVVQMAE
ncbi:MAG: hypothetical protein JXD18_03595 [Anaerolineae bacterium]|nr:hypothetical protein [Anaerolineae bacterium]